MWSVKLGERRVVQYEVRRGQDLKIDLPCPISRFPTPKHLEASAMPPQDLRLNYLGRREAT